MAKTSTKKRTTTRKRAAASAAVKPAPYPEVVSTSSAPPPGLDKKDAETWARAEPASNPKLVTDPDTGRLTVDPDTTRIITDPALGNLTPTTPVKATFKAVGNMQVLVEWKNAWTEWVSIYRGGEKVYDGRGDRIEKTDYFEEIQYDTSGHAVLEGQPPGENVYRVVDSGGTAEDLLARWHKTPGVTVDVT